jgi:hypothetical protein
MEFEALAAETLTPPTALPSGLLALLVLLPLGRGGASG